MFNNQRIALPRLSFISATALLVVVYADAVMGAATPGVDARNAIGLVADYDPVGLKLKRDNLDVAARIGSPVFADDSVTLAAGARLTISLASGETRNLNGPGTRVVGSGPALGALAIFFKSLRMFADAEHRYAATANTRGDAMGAAVSPLELPFPPKGALLSAGRQPLAIAWLGGSAPFDTRLLRGQRTTATTHSTERQTVFEGLTLEVGDYDVEVRDKRGDTAKARLIVRAAAPRVSTDLAAGTTTLARVARAVWVADQERGAWRLEGYRMLWPMIAAGDPLAREMGRGLLAASEESLVQK